MIDPDEAGERVAKRAIEDERQIHVSMLAVIAMDIKF